MYISGWGFHTNWRCIVEAALVWRSIRLLRLVRLRHQKDLIAGLIAVNLASLPQEIIYMVENVMISTMSSEVYGDPPFSFDMQDCCFDALQNLEFWQPYEDAFDQYLVQHGLELDDDEDFEIAMKSFSETQLAEELHDTYMALHCEDDDCKQTDMEHHFWQLLPRGEHFETAPYNLHRLVCNSQTLSKTFVELTGGPLTVE